MTEKRYYIAYEHYIVYRTTCLKNGKYYIGCHFTDDLNDGYLGSGVELKKDIARYGRSAFVREIIYSCSSRDEAAFCERELVNREVVNDPNSYNQRIGGTVRGAKIGSVVATRELQKEAVRKSERRMEMIKRKDSPKFREELFFRCVNDEDFLQEVLELFKHRTVFCEKWLKIVERERYTRKRRRELEEKFKNSAGSRMDFILRCKEDATFLQEVLELFKHRTVFCENLKNLMKAERLMKFLKKYSRMLDKLAGLW